MQIGITKSDPNELKIYQQWLKTCYKAGIPAFSTDTAARLMAILYEYGNNENLTHSPKFLADKDYIQDCFGLREMGTPELKFHSLLKSYVKELQQYYLSHKSKDTMQPLEELVPEWAPRLLNDRYGIKFIG